MSWQDDLRQLDQALAQGQVPADEYRKRRDQLLAAAAGGADAPTPPLSGPAAPEPPGQPQQPPAQQPPPPPPPQQQQPSSGGPFAPPFRWEPNPDATQVVSTSNPDATQVVSRPHNPEAERTQVVRPVSAPGQQQQQQFGIQSPWQTQQPEPAPPPWGMTDDGPVAAPNPTWLAQGPEVFDSGGGGKRGKVALIVVAVLVVVGLGVGAFLVFGNKNDPTPPLASSQTPQPPTSTTKPKDSLSVAELSGKVDDVSGITTFADAEQKGFLTPDEYKIYRASDPGKTRMALATLPDGPQVYIFTTEFTSPAKAATVADALVQQQITYGMKTRDGQPQGVRATEIDKATPDGVVAIRAHYLHNSTVVRIQVAAADLTIAGKAYDSTLKAQLDMLAATG
jgi:hypothetical protein